MRAVILAGGRGTRLAPYTTVVPKPLLPVGDKPILEIVCRQLVHAGFDRITLSLGYMSEYFKTFLAQHRSLRRLVDIDFVEEDEPTGTAGSLASIPDLEGTFLVMNGDILTDLSFTSLLEHHHRSEACVTIATHRKTVKIDLGILELQQDEVRGYIEKPTMSYPVSMGIYVYDERVLEFIEPGKYLDFPNLVLDLIQRKQKVAAYENNASWLDLGRYEDFQEACRIFEDREAQYIPKLYAA
jgi:NDP-sugar pyrophosphorylase family protein